MSISPVTMTSTDFQSQIPAASAASPQQPAAQSEPTVSQLHQAVNQINQAIQLTSSQNVQFSVDQQSGRVVVKVMDTQNNELIRQIPSPEILAIADALGKLQGIIITQKA